MTIKTVCERCALTKKAVAYYEQEGLIHPSILENGYRTFTEADVQTLTRISVLRAMGLPVAQIRRALSAEDGGGSAALRASLLEQETELERRRERISVLDALSADGDWAAARARLTRLADREAILDRLSALFPGSYGRYLRLHFGRFLHHSVETPEQREAFDTIVRFLDDARLSVPKELEVLLEEATARFDDAFANTVAEQMEYAIRNPEGYLDENAEQIAQYLAFKQSDEYRNSLAYRLSELMEAFQQESGYCEVFLPALRRLSSAYNDYSDALHAADTAFAARLAIDLTGK